MATARVTDLYAEVVVGGDATARVTDLYAEVITYPSPLARVTALYAEVILNVGLVATDADSIPSEEAFGTDGLVAEAIYGDASIPSEEAFGADGLLQAIVIGLESMGIPSEEAFGTDGLVLDATPPVSNVSSWQVWIGGVNRIENVMPGSIEVNQQSNFQSSAKFKFYYEDYSVWPAQGASILIMYYDVRLSRWWRIFAGSVEQTNKRKQPPLPKQNSFIVVSCVDKARAVSKRIINRDYLQANFGSLNAIMADINQQFLLPDGVTYVPIVPDVSLGDVSLPLMPLNEGLNKLGELAGGLNWSCDFDGNLTYADVLSAPPAPFDITEDSVTDWRDLEVIRTRGLYRNRQYVKATFSQTSTTVILTYILPLNKTIPPYDHVEYWDGTAFTDSRYTSGISRIVDIKLNGVSIPWFTLGQSAVPGWKYLQADPNALDLYWNMLEDPTGYPTVPGTELEFTVEMQNKVPGPIMAEDLAEIAARQAAEGGSGVYEAVEEVVDPLDEASLIAYAQALLDKFKNMGYNVNGNTRWYGLQPNQSVQVQLPNHGIASPVEMIVDNIVVRDRGRADITIDFQVSSNSTQRNALASWQRLVNRIRKSPIQNEKSATFVLAESIPGVDNPGMVVQDNVTAGYLVRRDMTLKEVAMYAKQPPTGSDAIIRINRNGSSIMASGYVMNFPAGETGIVRHVNFASANIKLVKDDVLTIDILQIGSDIPGHDLTVVVTGYV